MRVRSRKNIKAALGAAVLLVSGPVILGGCGGVEPEKRDYPLALAWNYEEGDYQVIYSMANLSQMTGQEKSNGDTPAGLVLTGKNLDELKEKYAKSQQYYLDLGHVQAVIFGQNLLQDPEIYGKVVEGMQDNPVLGKGAYVFAAGDPEEVMKLSAHKDDTIGEYLTGVYENHMGEHEESRTLEDVYYDWNNRKEVTDLPLLQVEESQVIVCGNSL